MTGSDNPSGKRSRRRIALAVAVVALTAVVVTAVRLGISSLLQPSRSLDDRVIEAATYGVVLTVGMTLTTLFMQRRLGGARNYTAMQEALKKKRLPNDRGDIDWPQLLDRQMALLRVLLVLMRVVYLVLVVIVIVIALMRPTYVHVTWLLLGTTALLAVVMELFGWWARRRVLRLRAQLDA
jgi:hypothetical protein